MSDGAAILAQTLERAEAIKQLVPDVKDWTAGAIYQEAEGIQLALDGCVLLTREEADYIAQLAYELAECGWNEVDDNLRELLALLTSEPKDKP